MLIAVRIMSVAVAKSYFVAEQEEKVAILQSQQLVRTLYTVDTEIEHDG